jgi:hypothetical protein
MPSVQGLSLKWRAREVCSDITWAPAITTDLNEADKRQVYWKCCVRHDALQLKPDGDAQQRPYDNVMRTCMRRSRCAGRDRRCQLE